MSELADLKTRASAYSLLFAEDNAHLRQQASLFFNKLFRNVLEAQDGVEALELFRKHYPKIVITDLKMPNMDGLSLIAQIKKLRPDTKVIIMSAHDDQETLIKGIELGVFRFIKKPASVTQLGETLSAAIEAIEAEERNHIFYAHLSDVFNYQSALVVMMQRCTILLASQRFLDFFAVDSIEAFAQTRGDLGSCLLRHEGFLYNEVGKDWFETASKAPDTLFHVKMNDAAHTMHHFIFKLHHVPDKEEYTILSFDDITELNLLGLFDGKKSKEDRSQTDRKKIFDLLGVIERNHAKVKIHDFYRGLSITNDAVLVDVKEDQLRLKTNFMQQKAMQIEKSFILASEALPNDIACDGIQKIDFDTQSVVCSGVRFLNFSPLQRKNIRLEPASEHTVTLFFTEHRFFGDLSILDLSVEAARISMNALPAGLDKGERVRLDMVLGMEKRQIIVNTEAILLKKSEQSRHFELIFTFDISNPAMKRNLTEYLAKRQMELIREFKGMQYGK